MLFVVDSANKTEVGAYEVTKHVNCDGTTIGKPFFGTPKLPSQEPIMREISASLSQNNQRGLG